MKALKPLAHRSGKSFLIAAVLIAFELIGTSQFALASGRITNVSNLTPNTILHGRGAPSTSLGKIGDFYIDLASMNMYGPKEKSGWASPISLKGPAGTPGASIISGSKSSQSSSLVASAKGEKGDRGEVGAAGPVGPAGAKGEKGEAGAVGPQGLQGLQGLPGTSGGGGGGPAGPQGVQGPQGIAGDKGETGTAGAVGATGAQGVKGDKGETGTATSAAKYGDITFASPISAPYSYQDSNAFGTFSGTSFVVDVFIYSTLQDGTAGNLGVAFNASGGLRIIHSNYIVGTGNSARTGSARIETSAICRLLVTVDAAILPKLVVTANSTNASSGNPQTLSGYFIVEDAGAVS